MATRAITVPEQNGLPSVLFVCAGFEGQAQATAAGLGTHHLPVAIFPGHINTYTSQEIRKNVQTIVVDAIVKALTVQPEEVKGGTEPNPTDVVLEGTFEEVNEFFYQNEWSEGLPIVPPTAEKVHEFLKFTGRSPDERIGVLLPQNREATVWNIAVNGVMAGCRPEYMPILIAAVEAMADSQFGVRHIGNTPGPEMQITLNGPLIKQLGFNYEQGALRPGFRPNISIGRFWRLYVRNVAGFLPHKTDKGTFGGTFRGVLAENEDFVTKIGWKPMSVDQGFKEGDNVITVGSCVCSDSAYAMGSDTAERTLDRIAARLVDTGIYYTDQTRAAGKLPMRHHLIITPCIAEQLAKHGYSKEKVKRYLWERAVFPARRAEMLWGKEGFLCQLVRTGALPSLYCESNDPDRIVPLYPDPEALMITVSGDPSRDNIYICAGNGQHGYPVSKKVELPKNWEKLLEEGKK